MRRGARRATGAFPPRAHRAVVGHARRPHGTRSETTRGCQRAAENLRLPRISAERRVLVVVPCYRQHDDVIRIISARTATPRERRTYRSQGSKRMADETGVPYQSLINL
ncbi:MAG: BrnT family toxin [Myxococcales bacterium]|nr:BrnT family toxin [Myxococcales bacterium]